VTEKDLEIGELRARVAELQQEKLREAREIERIKIEQERLDTEYRDIEESLGRQMQEKDERIASLTKDIMFLQSAMQTERQKFTEEIDNIIDKTIRETREELEREYER
jgi:hypothetical protein